MWNSWKIVFEPHFRVGFGMLLYRILYALPD